MGKNFKVIYQDQKTRKFFKKTRIEKELDAPIWGVEIDGIKISCAEIWTGYPAAVRTAEATRQLMFSAEQMKVLYAKKEDINAAFAELRAHGVKVRDLTSRYWCSSPADLVACGKAVCVNMNDGEECVEKGTTRCFTRFTIANRQLDLEM